MVPADKHVFLNTYLSRPCHSALLFSCSCSRLLGLLGKKLLKHHQAKQRFTGWFWIHWVSRLPAHRCALNRQAAMQIFKRRQRMTAVFLSLISMPAPIVFMRRNQG